MALTVLLLAVQIYLVVLLIKSFGTEMKLEICCLSIVQFFFISAFIVRTILDIEFL